MEGDREGQGGRETYEKRLALLTVNATKRGGTHGLEHPTLLSFVHSLSPTPHTSALAPESRSQPTPGSA